MTEYGLKSAPYSSILRLVKTINGNTSLDTDEYGALFSLYSVVFHPVYMLSLAFSFECSVYLDTVDFATGHTNSWFTDDRCTSYTVMKFEHGCYSVWIDTLLHLRFCKFNIYKAKISKWVHPPPPHKKPCYSYQ